jgi:catechol 2,3-dioxygenase-like lactoylglutathione lyase family enzyme
MAKVLGIGGVFFKARDAGALRAWYRRALGLDIHDWGGVFFTPDLAAAKPGAGTVWSPFKVDTDYFAPSTKDFMINFMVDDLDAVLARLQAEGVKDVKVLPDEVNGRFAHLLDPEGNKIELWEPKPMPA